MGVGDENHLKNIFACSMECAPLQTYKYYSLLIHVYFVINFRNPADSTNQPIVAFMKYIISSIRCVNDFGRIERTGSLQRRLDTTTLREH